MSGGMSSASGNSSWHSTPPLGTTQSLGILPAGDVLSGGTCGAPGACELGLDWQSAPTTAAPLSAPPPPVASPHPPRTPTQGEPPVDTG